MAINVQTLRTRALTALIFVGVMLAGLLWNQWSFIALFTVIHFGCWYEFIKLLKKINGNKWFVYAWLGLLYITLPVLAMLSIRLSPLSIGDNLIPINQYLLPCAIIFSIPKKNMGRHRRRGNSLHCNHCIAGVLFAGGQKYCSNTLGCHRSNLCSVWHCRRFARK